MESMQYKCNLWKFNQFTKKNPLMEVIFGQKSFIFYIGWKGAISCLAATLDFL